MTNTKAPEMVERFKSNLAALGFTSVRVERHGGLEPRWLAYGFGPDGRHHQTTFHGERDWRSALKTMERWTNPDASPSQTEG